MHFIVPDFCNQNWCFILVTRQWFKYSTHPNGSTLYTKKSHAFKNDWNPFLSFVSHNDWLQIHRRFSLRKMAPNFEAVVSVLLQICGQLFWGMPYPCIFVEEVVQLLGYCNVTNDPWISICILMNCIVIILSMTKIICLKIIFPNVIKSKEF